MTWDPATRQTFDQMSAKIPVFLRGIAVKNVSAKAEQLAQQYNRSVVTEKDLIDAFFAATPFGFHGPMKTDMQDLGIDYTKYGHPK